MTNIFSLEGKLAVVTGARRGIGLAMATALAEAGSDIIGVSSHMESGDSELRRRVESLGRKFTPLSADFSDRESVARMINELQPLQIDILVNNAGSIERQPAVEHSLDFWDRIIEINLSSQFVLTQAVGRKMLERKSGKIIFTASLLSFQGGINVPGYTASKSAIVGLVKALSNEWASQGVSVNAIAPGYIETDNTKALREDPVRYKSILDRIPAGRWGTPEDLAGATVFLASQASNYVSGITLPVDGGWLGR
ncbi:MAG TPA: SDR family oxidoreductase [Candidatus Nanopelagicaceae bacterium]